MITVACSEQGLDITVTGDRRLLLCKEHAWRSLRMKMLQLVHAMRCPQESEVHFMTAIYVDRSDVDMTSRDIDNGDLTEIHGLSNSVMQLLASPGCLLDA